MRVAFAALFSPYDRWSWSGIPYYSLRETLRRFPDTIVIDTPRFDHIMAKSGGLKRFGIFLQREPAVVAWAANYFRTRMEEIKPDVIVSVEATLKVAAIADRWPVVHATDGMFGSIIGSYATYAKIHRRYVAAGEALQLRLVQEGRAFLFASDWAAKEAARLYGLSPERSRVAPMGANLEESPARVGIRGNDQPLRLLFVGFAWERKGGPRLLSIFEHIRRAMPTAELHLVGCPPDVARGIDGVIHHGIIDKSDAGDRRRLADLFTRSSFFVMPSLGEAYGLVYCEAAAFGLPTVGNNVGGVPTIIHDGENGMLLPLEAEPQDYAARILAVWRDPEAYARMQGSARQHYEQRLNWQAWGAHLEDAIRQVVGR